METNEYANHVETEHRVAIFMAILTMTNRLDSYAVDKLLLLMLKEPMGYVCRVTECEYI